ncbi:hypothetical protein ACOME3_006966 [Neoechinorhynchus agilis]
MASSKKSETKRDLETGKSYRKPFTFLRINCEKFVRFIRSKKEDNQRESIGFGYDEFNGPLQWCMMYPVMKRLKYQSPIYINSLETIYDPALRGIKMKLSSNCCQHITNAGFTIQVTGDPSGCFTSGGILKDKYYFDHFHMHWGPDNQTGSEHVMDGKVYPAEIHIVFYNADKYTDFKKASQSMSFDGLVIFCIFVKEGQTSAAFSLLAEAAHNLTYKGDTYKLPEQFDVNNLLPGKLFSQIIPIVLLEKVTGIISSLMRVLCPLRRVTSHAKE